MAVTLQPLFVSFQTSGATATFTFPFRIVSVADLVVLMDGAPVTLANPGVTGVGQTNGGTLTLSVIPPAGRRLLITRRTSLVRTSTYASGVIRADDLNTDFDRLWLAAQDQAQASDDLANAVQQLATAVATAVATASGAAATSSAALAAINGAAAAASATTAAAQALVTYAANNLGRNITQLGSFAAARAAGLGAAPQLILAATALAQTAGWGPGSALGGASYERRAALTDAQLAQFPRSTFRSVDENGAVSRWMITSGTEWALTQFGAVPDDGGAGGPQGTDCFPAFNEMMLLNAAFPVGANFGVPGRTLRVPPGYFYSSQTWSLKGRWDVTGCGGGAAGGQVSAVRFAANTLGVVVNNGNTDGATFYQTQAAAAAAGTFVSAADASAIRRLLVSGQGGNTYANLDKHGIWLRARATIEDVVVQGFPGNGVHIVANSGTFYNGGGNGVAKADADRYFGNANDFQLNRVTVSALGGHGFFVGGSDVNAGNGVACEVLGSGLGGIMDCSFLGNTWTGCSCHVSNTAIPGGVGIVYYNGAVYSLAVQGSDGLTIISSYDANGKPIYTPVTPDQNPAWYQNYLSATNPGAPVWSPNGPGSGYPVYFCVCPLYSNGSNSRSVFTGSYVESGQAPSAVYAPSIAIGGLNAAGYTRSTPFLYCDGGLGGITGAPTGVGSVAYCPPTHTDRFGAVIGSYLGGRWFDYYTPGVVWQFFNGRSDGFQASILPGNAGWTFGINNGYAPTWLTFHARGTAAKFGRQVTISKQFTSGQSDQLMPAFGYGAVFRPDDDGRRVYQGQALPVPGEPYRDGEIYLCTAPATTRSMAYACTAPAVLNAGLTAVVTDAVWTKAGALFVDATAPLAAFTGLQPNAATAATTVTGVAGAALGDLVSITYVGDPGDVQFVGRVSAANSVTYRATNPQYAAAASLGPGTLKIRVEKM